MTEGKKCTQTYSPSIQQSVTAESEKRQSVIGESEKGQTLTAQFSLYLPDKALLQYKLAEWTAEFEEVHGERCSE